MKTLITIFLFTVNVIVTYAQQAYVIQLGVFKDKNLNLATKNFESLNYFGIVFPERESNGITKVFLKDFKGYFTESENAKKILKKVRKQFRDAFIKSINGNEVFQEPKIAINDKEILVSFRINDYKNPQSNEIVTPKGYDLNSIIEYRLYLGCWDKKSAWQVKNQLPQRFRGINYKLITLKLDRDDIKCNKYYFIYNNSEKALIDAQELKKESIDVAFAKREKDENGIYIDKFISLK